MLKRLRYLPIVAVVTMASIAAQQGPSFEVASIKRNITGPGPVRNVMWPTGGRMTATGLTVRELIRSAYIGDGLQLMTQIVGGPRWIDTDRFDILAKEANVPAGDADDVKRQRSAMLRSLLADRLKLKVHTDTRLLPVFDLVLAAKNGQLGPLLRVSTCNRLAAPPGLAASDSPHPCVLSRLVGMDPATGLTMGYEGMTMPAIATMLVGFPEIDRPIRDRTGLTGAFDLELTLPMPLPPGQSPPGAAPNLGAGTDSGILTALAEQLGLKLEGRRDQADVIVVDSVEQPTAD